MKNARRAAQFAALLTIAIQDAGSLTAVADSTYVGPATGSWNNAANWSNNTIPNGAVNVFIDGGNTAQNSTVTTNGSFSVNSITIDLGDTLIITPNTNFTVN